MLHSVKDDLNLCRDLNVTPKQLMFVKMLYKNPSMSERDWQLQSDAMTMEFQDVCPFDEKELNDLIERKIITDLNTPNARTFYDCFEINPKFQKLFSLKVVPWVSQIVDSYPRFFHMEGKRFNAVTVSAEEIAEVYIRAIDNKQEMHEEVLRVLEWAKENEMIKMGVEKFIKTKHWLSLKLLNNESKRNVNDAKLG